MQIEIVLIFVGVSIALPVIALFITKGGDRMLLDMFLFLVGVMWIIFFGFILDEIKTGEHIDTTTVVGATTTYTYEDDIFPMNEPSGEPTITKSFITFIGLAWVLLGALNQYKSRGGWGRGY